MSTFQVVVPIPPQELIDLEDGQTVAEWAESRAVGLLSKFGVVDMSSLKRDNVDTGVDDGIEIALFTAEVR